MQKQNCEKQSRDEPRPCQSAFDDWRVVERKAVTARVLLQRLENLFRIVEFKKKVDFHNLVHVGRIALANIREKILAEGIEIGPVTQDFIYMASELMLFAHSESLQQTS